MNRDEWLEARRQGIGSSDAAAVCGLKPFGLLPLDVYLDKVGLLPPRESAPLRWGLRLEEVIAFAYEDETGRNAYTPPKSLHWHRQYPWMLATPDRLTDDDRVVELKTAATAAGWGEPGTDEIPEPYLVQVQHQLAVLGLDAADVAVLIAGSDFRVYEVPRREDIINRLLWIEQNFWDRVQRQDPPPLDWEDPRTPELVGLLYRPAKGKVVELGEESLVRADEYLGVAEAIRELERAKQFAKARLIEAMKDAEVGLLPDGREVVRALRHRKGYQVAEGEWTDFRIRKARGR